MLEQNYVKEILCVKQGMGVLTFFKSCHNTYYHQNLCKLLNNCNCMSIVLPSMIVRMYAEILTRRYKTSVLHVPPSF